MGCLSILRRRLPSVFAASTPAAKRPAVGVGVVIFRHLVENTNPEVLLIRRGKAPSKGLISFPGGRQELGETVIECAIREAREECGVELRHDSTLLRNIERRGATRVPRAHLRSRTLSHPVPFTAVDVMAMSEEEACETELDKMVYHYGIIEVAGTVANARKAPVAADDADDCFWWDTSDFLASEDIDIVPNLKHVVELALDVFDIPKQ